MDSFDAQAVFLVLFPDGQRRGPSTFHLPPGSLIAVQHVAFGINDGARATLARHLFG